MTAAARVSVVTVTYNPGRHLAGFLKSVKDCDRSDIDLELVVVDNGSADGTVDWLQEHRPDITLIINDENNYARALNKAIEVARGEYIVITNNDAEVESGWLKGLLAVIGRDEHIGAVQSKLLFADGRGLNSAGVEEIESFYFADIGWGEADGNRFASPVQRDYVSGGSVMFRRACLEDVGAWDERLLMYMEDIDYSIRSRQRGWALWYGPESVVRHHYHGSASEALCDFLCNRNRFLLLAKHFPRKLAGSIATSHFLMQQQFDWLCRSLLAAVRVLCEEQTTETVLTVLEQVRAALIEQFGQVAAAKFFSHLEVFLGLRPIRVGIYDHAGHFPGGGQRYVAEMAAVMQDRYEVTYLFNNEVSLDKYREWFDLDLSRCSSKIVPLPFFVERGSSMPDEGITVRERHNVFDPAARESLDYDIFINSNMLTMVNPLSPVSLFVCHFPDRKRTRFFQVDQYTHLLINGRYTGEWVRKRWQLEPSTMIHPPVQMDHPDSAADSKERIILSVSRFEISGSKKQLEMVQAFRKLCRRHPEATRGWKLILAGGSVPNNPYLENVRTAVEQASADIEIQPNLSVAAVRELYRRSAIFWHACGLKEKRPERVEHFGMTTVEAMQNYCVPVVIDGGGQREIVEHGQHGFRFKTLTQLRRHTLELIEDEGLRLRLGEQAYGRGQRFNRKVFRAQLDELLARLELEITGADSLENAVSGLH
jgi:GT2 family glycosyltransferase